MADGRIAQQPFFTLFSTGGYETYPPLNLLIYKGFWAVTMPKQAPKHPKTREIRYVPSLPKRRVCWYDEHSSEAVKNWSPADRDDGGSNDDTN